MIFDVINYWEWYLGVIALYVLLSIGASAWFLHKVTLLNVAKMLIMVFLVIKMVIYSPHMFYDAVGWGYYAVFIIANNVLFKEEREREMV